MKVYGLTKVGQNIVSTKESNSPEYKVLARIRDGGKAGATDQEIEESIPDGRFIVKGLVRRGLVLEFTT